MTRVAVLGATGYGGGELLRFLLPREDVRVVHATSRTRAGQLIGSVHRNFEELSELRFTDPSTEQLLDEADFIFGAMPHGESVKALEPFIRAGKRVIDLSADYRLKSPDDYARWYHRPHEASDLLAGAVYGLPELNREAIATAQLVACPGCFATAIELALLPAARKGWLTGRIDVTAMTGSSGSGMTPGEGTHHPLRDGNLRAYKVLEHQHEPEILQTLREAGGSPESLAFTPISAPLVRGILAVVQTDLPEGVTEAEVEAAFRECYATAPFIKLIRGREPQLTPIVTTNFVEVRARRTPQGRLHVTTAIDNLVKGASGQAVQCMNLMLGLPETTGLSQPGFWP